MKPCEICGQPGELHHIIFKSQAKYLERVPTNFKYLCPEHHRGNNSPHKSRKKDLELKKELQAKYEIMLTQDYYNLEEIKKILDINDKVAQRVINKMIPHQEGYKREELLARLMGGRLY